MPSNYSGDPSATQSPASPPGPGVLPVLALPDDPDFAAGNLAELFAQPKKVLLDYLAYISKNATRGNFGDGSDGAATADGASGVPGATRINSFYTLTRDVFFTDLTISNGITIYPAGWRIFCRGTLTTIGTGKIAGDGTPAVNQTKGSNAYVTGAFCAPGADGATGTSSTGAAGSATGTSGLGGAGGAGGTSTINTPGAGGSGANGSSILRACDPPYLGFDLAGGGGGGAGGGAGSTNYGGGGGAGGNIIAVAARTVRFAGALAITAIGGAGGTGLTNAGGGGGGGGGGIVLAYQMLALASGSLLASVNCAGGAGGQPGGNDPGFIYPGVAGTAGGLLLLQV